MPLGSVGRGGFGGLPATVQLRETNGRQHEREHHGDAHSARVGPELGGAAGVAGVVAAGTRHIARVADSEP